MLCQKCGKNEAEVHFVQTINGERTEALLCGKCAAESGLGISPISFTNFLQGFMDTTAPVYQESANIQCEKCGMTLREMKSAGKVGCAQCYNTFEAQMEAIIKNVQAGNSHTGKIPKRASHIYINREINVLRRKLVRAIESENYEEAATIRDAIKSLKDGGLNG